MAVTANQTKKKEERRVFGDRFNEADFSTGRFDHKCEAGLDAPRKLFLVPEYWSHVAEKMTPYSRITVRCDDGSFYGEYLVMDCGRGWARLHELGWWNLTSKDVAMSQSDAGVESDYEIVHKGPNRKWVVLRKSDQVSLHDGESVKLVAQQWLDNYLSGKGAKDPKLVAQEQSL